MHSMIIFQTLFHIPRFRQMLFDAPTKNRTKYITGKSNSWGNESSQLNEVFFPHFSLIKYFESFSAKFFILCKIQWSICFFFILAVEIRLVCGSYRHLLFEIYVPNSPRYFI